MSEPETPKTAQEKRDEEHWTVRRQRMVRCKVHGLHYDPRLTSGCAKCRKEGLIAAPAREKPQFLPLLLLILAIVLVIYSVFLPGFRKRGVVQEELVPETLTAHKLDPDGYREKIEKVETALYDNPATNIPLMVDDARLALTALAEGLNASPHHIGQRAAKDADELKAHLPEDSELATVEGFEQARAEWPAFRSRYFSTVSWFRPLLNADKNDDRVKLAAYRDLAGDLLALVGEGSARAEELSSERIPSWEDQERPTREWQRYREEWLGRVEALRSQLPGRPGIRADSEVLIATQHLEQAFSEAKSLAGTKLDSATASRFEAALSLSEKAHRSFDDILLR